MKKVLLTACTIGFALQVLSQENIWWKTPVNSPEVNKDNTVTFRLKAPNASSVEIVGDFLSRNEKAEMKKVDTDVWEYTTPKPLNPELYSYSYKMDGVKISDPSNVFMSRDVVTISNLFMIDGKESELYKVQNVPHGTLSKVWYHSDKHNADRRITVYTPAGYETSNKKYPVLYLLHGMGGDEDSWSTLGRAPHTYPSESFSTSQGAHRKAYSSMSAELRSPPVEQVPGFLQSDYRHTADRCRRTRSCRLPAGW